MDDYRESGRLKLPLFETFKPTPFTNVFQIKDLIAAHVKQTCMQYVHCDPTDEKSADAFDTKVCTQNIDISKQNKQGILWDTLNESELSSSWASGANKEPHPLYSPCFRNRSFVFPGIHYIICTPFSHRLALLPLDNQCLSNQLFLIQISPNCAFWIHCFKCYISSSWCSSHKITGTKPEGNYTDGL